MNEILKEYYQVNTLENLDTKNYTVRGFYKLYEEKLKKLEINKDELFIRQFEELDRQFCNNFFTDSLFYSYFIHKDLVKNKQGYVLVYKDIPIGAVYFNKSKEKLSYFAIQRTINGKGLGKQFIKLLKQENLIKDGLLLESWEQEKSNPTGFWEKMGFKKVDGKKIKKKKGELQKMIYTK